MKVKRITNRSNVQVELLLAEGSMFLPPRASATNVDVFNLSELEGVVSVERDLTEVMPDPGLELPPAVEKQSAGVRADLSEVSRPPKKRKRKKKLNG